MKAKAKKKKKYSRRSIRLCFAGIAFFILLCSLFVLCTDTGQELSDRLYLQWRSRQGSPELLCPREYAEAVARCGAQYSVPENLLYAVIQTESAFDAEAVSSAGAKGLMQLMPATFEWIAGKAGISLADAETEIFDPDKNIQCGTCYLRFLYETFGSWMEAVAAYNAGQGRVALWLEDENLTDADGILLPDAIPYTETRRYVKKVRAYYAAYEQYYPSAEPADFDKRTLNSVKEKK